MIEVTQTCITSITCDLFIVSPVLYHKCFALILSTKFLTCFTYDTSDFSHKILTTTLLQECRKSRREGVVFEPNSRVRTEVADDRILLCLEWICCEGKTFLKVGLHFLSFGLKAFLMQLILPTNQTTHK